MVASQRGLSRKVAIARARSEGRLLEFARKHDRHGSVGS